MTIMSDPHPDDAASPAPTAADPDGLPSDPLERRVAVAMLTGSRDAARPRRVLVLKGARALDRSRGAGRGSKGSARSDVSEEAMARAEAVLDAMVLSGRILDLGDGLFGYSPPKGRLAPDTPEARRLNYAAAVGRIAGRVAKTEPGRARTAMLYRMIGAASMYRRIELADGGAVVAPCEVAITEDGVAVSRAVVVTATRKGIRCHSIAGDGIRTSFPTPDVAVIDIDPSLLAIDRPLNRMVIGVSLLPLVRDGYLLADSDIGRSRKNVNASVARQRDRVCAFVGENLSAAAWNSLNASLRRRTARIGVFRAMLFSVLDREIRAACLRDPTSTVALYNWFCHRRPETRSRRLQASAAYPLLTRFLNRRELSAVIDDARPLAPAIASFLDVPQSSVRQIVGLNWQKFRSPHRILSHERLTQLLRMTSLLVPEDRPRKRAEWLAALDLSESFFPHLPYPLSPTVAHGLRRLATIERLAKVHVMDAIDDLSTQLRRVIDLTWEVDWSRRWFEYDLLIRTVMGENGGAKRLVAFAEDWHRGAARRTACVRSLERRSASIETKRWAPMTAEPFRWNGGTLRWLCDEDELAAEGLEMRHCVGSYVTQCHLGDSHIASVVDAAGNRSTAEFCLPDPGKGGRRIRCLQNNAAGNAEASPGCREIVGEFLRRAGNGGGLVQADALRSARLERRAALGMTPPAAASTSGRAGPMSPEDAAALVGLYDDCLPRNARLPPDEWRALAAARAPEAGREPVPAPAF